MANRPEPLGWTDQGADPVSFRPAAALIAAAFADAHPPLSADQAIVEANRCYFCHDAPCIAACPTAIDIPRFIRGIATGNLLGAARTIFESNIMGGTCARVCPTDVLCEGACVRRVEECRPVAIGALQRRATDWLMARGGHPFTRARASGRRVAVVGAGPAGLACAHALARLGHEVVVFEARDKPGGLNEYGIAAYKMADDFAQAEVGFILGIGGIRLEQGVALGREVTLDGLRAQFDAVFLGFGQAAVKPLGLAGESLEGVRNAVDFIAELRQTADRSALPIGRRVVVIGGGNTAIDAATQARRLGAEEVTMVYRRGKAQMSATPHEQDWAQTNGVTIRHWAAPVAIEGREGRVGEVVFARTRPGPAGEAVLSAARFRLPADLVLKAVGQSFDAAPLGAAGPALRAGRILIDPATGATSLPAVFAGGDCAAGPDLTVQAVADGGRAAAAIHAALGR